MSKVLSSKWIYDKSVCIYRFNQVDAKTGFLKLNASGVIKLKDLENASRILIIPVAAKETVCCYNEAFKTDFSLDTRCDSFLIENDKRLARCRLGKNSFNDLQGLLASLNQSEKEKIKQDLEWVKRIDTLPFDNTLSDIKPCVLSQKYFPSIETAIKITRTFWYRGCHYYIGFTGKKFVLLILSNDSDTTPVFDNSLVFETVRSFNNQDDLAGYLKGTLKLPYSLVKLVKN